MEKKIKSLITEDSAVFGREECEILSQYGIEVNLCQKDGIEVLEKIDSLRPDVVLLDLFMTRIDGIGVLRPHVLESILVRYFCIVDVHLRLAYL